ncbi:MAG: trypsin-like serine protease [Cyanobacteria bacterium SBLK]|nr:trypsin-like serine protease [Cyanobacteria bacterium SBLK]
MPDLSAIPSTVSPFLVPGIDPNPSNGRRQEPRAAGETIVGDNPDPYPWMAALMRSNQPNTTGQFASGTLIHSQWILTTAHSVVGLNPDAIDVLLETNSLRTGGTRYDVAEVIIHPDYDPDTFDSDIALLRLSTPVTNITPIGLVEQGDPDNLAAVGTSGRTLGWSVVSDIGSSATRLYEVENPIVARETANQPQSYNGQVTDKMLAAGQVAGSNDFARGNSGSPLIVPEGNDFVQAGIVSFDSGVPRPNFYGVYTQVSSFTDWIREFVPLATTTRTGFSVSNLSIQETNADREIELTVNLATAPTDQNAPVTIDYAIASGTAIAGTDYDAGTDSTLTGTLTFEAGETSKIINLVIKGDRAAESVEDFSITLSNASSGIIDRAVARIFIRDNDSPPVARNDTASTTPNTAVVIPVLLNDTDSNGQGISIQNADGTSANGGTVSVQGNSLVYTPRFGFIGGDTFTYRIVNDDGRTSAATVRTAVVVPRRFDKRLGEQNPLNAFAVAEFSNPVLVDIDGDGDLDAFVGDRSGNLNFSRNTGTRTKPVFDTLQANPFNLTGVVSDSAPAFVDIDGDGDFDAFVGDRNGDVLFFENQGTPANPNFATSRSNPFNWSNNGTYATPTFADINGDGDLDAFVGTASGDIYFLENTGNRNSPNFTQPILNAFGLQNISGFSAPSLVDIDGDGDFDLMAGRNATEYIYFANVGTTTAPDFIPVVGAANPFNGLGTETFGTLAFGDIDGDDDPDAFLGNARGTLEYLRNFGTDADGDEVADQMERVAGDRNLDGIPDSQQASVVSLATFNGDPGDSRTFVTLAAQSPGTRFTFAESLSSAGLDAPVDPLGLGAQFPIDFLRFNLNPASSSTVLNLIVPEEPANLAYNTFWIYDDNQRRWSEFIYNGSTGAQFFDLDGDGRSDRILLHYGDNQRGDINPQGGNIGSILAAGEIDAPLSLRQSNNAFIVTGNGGFASLEVTLEPSDSDRVSEVGIFKVDELNRVNGISPGEDQFKNAALQAGTTIFNVLSNRSDDLIGGLNLTRRLPIAPGERFMFYFITKGTRDTILYGDAGETEVYFSTLAANDDNFDHARIRGTENLFTIGWEESLGGSDTDYEDLVMRVTLNRNPLSVQDLAANLQGGQEGEVIDLRNLDGQNIRTSFPIVRSDAEFGNTVGLYRIETPGGTVRHPVTGQRIDPGSPGYTDAALRLSQESGSGIAFDRNGSGAATTLQGGGVFAPFIIANNTVDGYFNSTDDAPAVYFAFARANTDTRDHIQLLGNNIYGFEDLPELGDGDFNDMIFSVEVAIG